MAIGCENALFGREGDKEMKTKLLALFLVAGSCAFAAPFRVGVRVGVGVPYRPYYGGYGYYAPPVVPYVAPYAVAPYPAYGYGYGSYGYGYGGYGYGVGIGVGGYGYRGGYGYGVRVAPRGYYGGGGRVAVGRRR